MTLGEIIYLYRQENGISQRKFADLCKNKVTHGYISMLEKNRNPNNGKPLAPSIEVYKAVADAMRISFDDLLSKLDGEACVTVEPATPSQIDTITRLAARLTPDQQEEAARYLEFLLSKQ